MKHLEAVKKNPPEHMIERSSLTDAVLYEIARMKTIFEELQDNPNDKLAFVGIGLCKGAERKVAEICKYIRGSIGEIEVQEYYNGEVLGVTLRKD